MKFAYLVCFVALLQISTCQDDTESSTVTLPSTPLTETANLNTSETESNEDNVTTSTVDSTTTDNEVPDTISYDPNLASPASTEISTEESSKMAEEQSTTAKPNRGDLVYPTALVIALVPLCIRLVSINLVGVV